jgi:hypothetical protein
VNYDFGRKDKLYLSGYFGQDRFFARSTDNDRTTEGGLKWGNATATLRWNHLFNNRLFANASLIFSNYRFNIYQLDEDKKASTNWNTVPASATFPSSTTWTSCLIPSIPSGPVFRPLFTGLRPAPWC